MCIYIRYLILDKENPDRVNDKFVKEHQISFNYRGMCEMTN